MPSLHFLMIDKGVYPLISLSQKTDEAISLTPEHLPLFIVSLLNNHSGLFLSADVVRFDKIPTGKHFLKGDTFTYVNRSYLSIWRERLLKIKEVDYPNLVNSVF